MRILFKQMKENKTLRKKKGEKKQKTMKVNENTLKVGKQNIKSQ